MKTQLKRMLFCQAFMKTTACIVLSACTLSAMAYSEESMTQVSEITQQNRTVKGNVTDANGTPIIGANVMEKGTTNGTITDIDGNFSLNVSPNATLVISYIGYKSQEVSAAELQGGKQKITLKEDSEIMDEVIVVGYGTQKKATLTGSVSQVGGEDLKKVAAANLTNTLAGKTAGIIANTRSGEPGEDNADILIRGKGTLGSTSPLIVVDGIADRSFSHLNPEDIESISVLKDASAAIYGARAANGVILVTTKRGKEGKISVNYNGSYSISQPTKIPEMLNAYQYATYVNEYDADPRHDQAGITYSDEVLQHYLNHDDPINYPDTDWWNEVAKSWAGKTQHSLSISGGTDKISFYTSAQYMWQDAIYKNSAQDYKQFQLMSNIDAQINKSIRFSLDILGRQEQRQRGIYTTPYLFTYFLSTFPGSAPYYPNGLPRVGYDGVTRNAAIMVTDQPGSNNYTTNVINIKPLLHVDLDFITKGLYAEGYAAIDYTFSDGKQINQPYDLYYYDNATQEYQNRRSDTGQISLNDWATRYSTITLNARIGYERTFNDSHKVNAFVAYEQSKYNYHTLSGYRTNFLSNTLMDLFAGSDVPADKDNNGSSDKTARVNFFGRVNYSYMDKYLAEVTMRYDGSMNFAKGHRWGLFPSFSLGWVISEEKFFEPVKPYIDFLKLKASWGQMGNDNITAYQYLSQYAFADSGAYFGTGDAAAVNKGFYLTRTANPLVTWETANTTNLGFSASFLNGKFTLDFDWFKSKRSDILITRSASIPAYTGLVLPAENLGKVNNSGVEIVASYHDRTGDFEWGITGNFTYAENKVVYMDEAISTPEWQRTTGNPIDGLVLYKALGIYQNQAQVDATKAKLATAAPGELIFVDVNGDGKITNADKTMIGDPNPDFRLGFSINLGYKGFDFSLTTNGAFGHQIVKSYRQYLASSKQNFTTDIYECWNGEGTSNRMPSIKNLETSESWKNFSDIFVEDGNYLRAQNITLGYDFKQLFPKMPLQQARLYVSVLNAFTITNYSGMDPEVGSSGNDSYSWASGIDLGFYPSPRTYMFGVNLKF